MRTYTAHLRPGDEPLLVREGFSWGAALFGPLWLLLRRAWIAAVLTLAIGGVLTVLAPPDLAVELWIGFAWLLGLVGHDLRRWGLERRGYSLEYVVLARNLEDAYARLLTNEDDLVAELIS